MFLESYVVAYARLTAANAATGVAKAVVGATDSTYDVSANVLVTTATTHNFTVTAAYTDETNTARTETIAFRLVGDTTATTAAIVNANGTVPYLGIPQRIRCKAATTIVIASAAGGTYTTVVYNIEGLCKLISAT